jgi:hypothetical protein
MLVELITHHICQPENWLIISNSMTNIYIHLNKEFLIKLVGELWKGISRPSLFLCVS